MKTAEEILYQVFTEAEINDDDIIPILRVEEAMELYAKQFKECALGVGNGDGQHFVYGDYEYIKLLQTKIINWEKENSRLLEEKAKLIEQIEHFRKVASENKIQSGAGTFSSAKFGGRVEMCEEILKALTSPQ